MLILHNLPSSRASLALSSHGTRISRPPNNERARSCQLFRCERAAVTSTTATACCVAACVSYNFVPTAVGFGQWTRSQQPARLRFDHLLLHSSVNFRRTHWLLPYSLITLRRTRCRCCRQLSFKFRRVSPLNPSRGQNASPLNSQRGSKRFPCQFPKGSNCF